MSLLAKLNHPQFIEFIRSHPNLIPPFVDVSTKNKWLNLMSIFHDKTIFTELAKNAEWKDRVDLLTNMMTKIESQELEIIKKEYLECYNKFIQFYDKTERKTLRYLIYKYGYESEFNDVFCEQRLDEKFLTGSFTNKVIYLGNPHLYVSNESYYGSTFLKDMVYMKDYKLECFLDCKIDPKHFISNSLNPALGKFRSSEITEPDILYVILKVYDLEDYYSDLSYELSDSDSE